MAESQRTENTIHARAHTSPVSSVPSTGPSVLSVAKEQEPEPLDNTSGSSLERHKPPQKQYSAFPFFQNPRAPLTPAVESSWGGVASPGMIPFSGLYPVKTITTPSGTGNVNGFQQSTEYNDKYGVQALPQETEAKRFCPICEEAINGTEREEHPDRLRRPSKVQRIVKGPHDHVYHIACIQCRACRQLYLPTDSMTVWTWVGASSPYHRTCMVQGAKPMLERLKRRLSLAGLTVNHPPLFKQEIRPSLLPGLSEPAQQLGPSSETVAAVKKPEFLKSLPSLFSVRGTLEPCASCGHALRSMESLLDGPNNTKHHASCLSRCAACGQDFKGRRTNWFAYSQRGLVRSLCRECWAEGRSK
ncbi:hypothetical protein MMC19_001818 [Ptychographa xylographoides]|nr:hypothetical protein [Ptychographa xylographoides]